MKTQWRKGFRRLLIVLSLIWITFASAVALAAAPPIKAPNPFDHLGQQEESTIAERIQRAKDAGFTDAEILQRIQEHFANSRWWESAPIVKPAPAETGNWWDQDEIVEQPQASTIKKPTWTQKLMEGLPTIFGPVLAVWIAYFAICWIAAGFRPTGRGDAIDRGKA